MQEGTGGGSDEEPKDGVSKEDNSTKFKEGDTLIDIVHKGTHREYKQPVVVDSDGNLKGLRISPKDPKVKDKPVIK